MAVAGVATVCSLLLVSALVWSLTGRGGEPEEEPPVDLAAAVVSPRPASRPTPAEPAEEAAPTLSAAAPAPAPPPPSEEKSRPSPPPAVPAKPAPPPPAVETPAAPAEPARPARISTADIVAESEPSVALIKGLGSSGTGFLVAPGVLATNSHVIDSEFVPKLNVQFVSADEKHKAPLPAELLYEDRERDIALLSVKTDLKPLRIAPVYKFRKGDELTVIGNPGIGDGAVLENAINRGVMSTQAKLDGKDFLQLGVSVNPGNSGGPVFDESGQVIGIVTLKSSVQEATSYAIPVEDLHAALAKLAGQTPADGERTRSRHRLSTAVDALGGSGAVLCLLIDIRRASGVSTDPQIRELQNRLEGVAADLEKEMFPTLTDQYTRVANDLQVPPSVRSKVGDLGTNFLKLRNAVSSREAVPDEILRPWKQTHRRLYVDLAKELKQEVPEKLLFAFEDHRPEQGPVITMLGPGASAGSSLRSRLWDRRPSGPSIARPPSLSRPPGISRPPSLRERFGRRR